MKNKIPLVKVNPKFIECRLFAMPLWGIDGYLLVKEIFYLPKELKLQHSIPLVRAYPIWNSEPEFNTVDLNQFSYFTAGNILSRSPRKRGPLKWILVNDDIPKVEDCLLPFFRVNTKEKFDINSTYSVVDLRLEKIRFQIPMNLGLHLPIYAHSNSDFISYLITFYWIKHQGFNSKKSENILLSNLEKKNFWPIVAFEQVYGYRPKLN